MEVLQSTTQQKVNCAHDAWFLESKNRRGASAAGLGAGVRGAYTMEGGVGKRVGMCKPTL